MERKTLTEREVLAALSCCGNADGPTCSVCPLYAIGGCVPLAASYALGLIERDRGRAEAEKREAERRARRELADALRTRARTQFDWNRYVDVREIGEAIAALEGEA